MHRKTPCCHRWKSRCVEVCTVIHVELVHPIEEANVDEDIFSFGVGVEDGDKGGERTVLTRGRRAVVRTSRGGSRPVGVKAL